MAIKAKVSNYVRELIEPGNYTAVCYKMIHIGTVEDTYMSEKKEMDKLRIGWELVDEMRVFDESKGPQPLVIDKEFTLSLGDKATLRKFLKSWRGKDFTEKEAEEFDITRLVGAACLLNIIVKTKKDGSGQYNDVEAATPLPKSIPKPKGINKPFILDFEENWSDEKFESLPDFIKDKLKTSHEYAELRSPGLVNTPAEPENVQTEDDISDDLPF